MMTVNVEPVPAAAPHAAWWPLAGIVACACLLYLPALATAPAYIGGDEARFATTAWSIATTGRDGFGNRMPLFFHLSDTAADAVGTRWYQPLLFYLVAATVRIGPFGEQSLRLPTVLIGVVDVVLIYAVARWLFGSALWAATAATLLMLTPAHLIFSRQALDYICPLPFVLGWLWCLLMALGGDRTPLFFAAGLVLGLGFYSYIAAWVMMPLLLAVTWAAACVSGRDRIRRIVAATLGFALPVAIAIQWLWTHPQMWRDTIGRYRVYDVQHATLLQGARNFLGYNNLQERLSVYWDYFNPAYLFFSGGSNLTTTTRQVGVFLAPVGIFLLVGVCALWRRRPVTATIVLLAGLMLAPLPATLVDERYAVQRELVLLPFAVLVGVFGVRWMAQQPRAWTRLAAVALLAAVPVQFAYFYRDYFAGYRLRSAYWFDPTNLRGVSDYLLSDTVHAAPALYFSENLDDVSARWQFFLIKRRRQDLLGRTHLFDAKTLDVRALPSDSRLVLYANDPVVPTWVRDDACVLETTILDLAGGRSTVILRRQ
ncbi:MAG TPA: glycosyltransferase family 39 protein [Vicinamibacterales bacterium]|nr:glycosyltransferase family 39 protein [Vicinamibacterales bacterium]